MLRSDIFPTIKGWPGHMTKMHDRVKPRSRSKRRDPGNEAGPSLQ